MYNVIDIKIFTNGLILQRIASFLQCTKCDVALLSGCKYLDLWKEDTTENTHLTVSSQHEVGITIKQLIHNSIITNDIVFFKWLFAHGVMFSFNSIYVGIQYKIPNIISYLLEIGVVFTEQIVVCAIKYNKLDLVQQFYHLCTTISMDYAAEIKNYVCLEWLYNNTPLTCSVKGVELLAFYGNFNLLKRHAKELNGKILNIAIIYGDLSIVQWIHQQRVKLLTLHGNTAMCYGHLHLVQWLFEKHITGNYFGVKYAASNGHLHILQWLDQKGLFIHAKSVANIATLRSHFLIMNWLYSKNITCTQYIRDKVAGRGNMQVLKWLYKRHLFCTQDGADKAYRNNHFNVVTWLHKKHEVSTLTINQHGTFAGIIQ